MTIPSNPDKQYAKNNTWATWGDWFGTGTVSTKNKKFRPFKEAREFVQTLKISGYPEWQEYCKSGNKPDDIPSNPDKQYAKNNTWATWGDWFGTGTVSTKNKKFRPFKEAREFVQTLKISGYPEWLKYCASGNKPDDIPSNPDKQYAKNNTWATWGDWFGTGTVASKNKKFRPFKEAREFVRSLGLKNWKEWQEYCASGNKPDDIPSNPDKQYQEWKKK